MSETPVDPTPAGRDDEPRHDLAAAADPEREARGDDAEGTDGGAGVEADLAEGDDVSAGTDGVGGGNDSRSSLLQDTLGAGGDPDRLDREQ
jgi:hypothetical protein